MRFKDQNSTLYPVLVVTVSGALETALIESRISLPLALTIIRCEALCRLLSITSLPARPPAGVYVHISMESQLCTPLST